WACVQVGLVFRWGLCSGGDRATRLRRFLGRSTSWIFVAPTERRVTRPRAAPRDAGHDAARLGWWAAVGDGGPPAWVVGGSSLGSGNSGLSGDSQARRGASAAKRAG